MKDWINGLPKERQPIMEKLVELLDQNLPSGFKRRIDKGFIHYEVPLDTYPKGYHCTSNTPLPFISLANQKNFIAIYHMGMYALPELSAWFQEEYKKKAKFKLDMGKSCVRLKRMDDVPYSVFEDLFKKVDVQQWINTYEANYLK